MNSSPVGDATDTEYNRIINIKYNINILLIGGIIYRENNKTIDGHNTYFNNNNIDSKYNSYNGTSVDNRIDTCTTAETLNIKYNRNINTETLPFDICKDYKTSQADLCTDTSLPGAALMYVFTTSFCHFLHLKIKYLFFIYF